MDILLDIVHSVDYGVLAYISEHWRGGLSDTVWKVFSLLGSYGAVWFTVLHSAAEQHSCFSFWLNRQGVICWTTFAP